jgi:hypothetical protein
VRDRLLNYALYQAGWLILVLAAANGRPWLGAALGLALVGIHVALARHRRPEISTILWIGLLGTLVDSIQAALGVFVFEAGYWTYWLVPFWISVMWLQFATLFHYALNWMSGRYLLSAALGAGGGPAAFLTGERLGGVIFPFGRGFSLMVLAAVWAVVTPAVVWIADRNRPPDAGGRYRVFGER